MKCHDVKTARNQEGKDAEGAKSNECTTSRLIFCFGCTNRDKNKQVSDGSSKDVKGRIDELSEGV